MAFDPVVHLAQLAAQESQNITVRIEKKMEELKYEIIPERRTYDATFTNSYKNIDNDWVGVEYAYREHPLYGLGWFPNKVTFALSDPAPVTFITEILEQLNQPIDLVGRYRLIAEAASKHGIDEYRHRLNDVGMLCVREPKKTVSRPTVKGEVLVKTTEDAMRREYGPNWEELFIYKKGER